MLPGTYYAPLYLQYHLHSALHYLGPTYQLCNPMVLPTCCTTYTIVPHLQYLLLGPTCIISWTCDMQAYSTPVLNRTMVPPSMYIYSAWHYLYTGLQQVFKDIQFDRHPQQIIPPTCTSAPQLWVWANIQLDRHPPKIVSPKLDLRLPTLDLSYIQFDRHSPANHIHLTWVVLWPTISLSWAHIQFGKHFSSNHILQRPFFFSYP